MSRLAAGPSRLSSIAVTFVRASVASTRIDLTIAPVDVSRAATYVVACASVPSARRLARHRAGHEPTRKFRVSQRGPSRLSSFAVARGGASVAPTRVLCSRGRVNGCLRAATGVVACATVPMHGASRVIALAMSQRVFASRRGTEPTIVDRRHSRARVCRADSGPVFSRSRRWLSPRRHGRGRLRVSAKCTAPHASPR